jgi:hypothetical protein
MLRPSAARNGSGVADMQTKTNPFQTSRAIRHSGRVERSSPSPAATFGVASSSPSAANVHA